VKPKYTAVIGTVRGDLHDIGKNLVAMMWRGAGFLVIDLGANVAPEEFVAAIQQHRPHVVGLSALLTTTMPAIAETITVIRATGAATTKILIGGAPVTSQWAQEIGADGFAPDAASSVEVALRFAAA
jgi:5-methyltetrahydrofolate--homocysteine methyltransferase